MQRIIFLLAITASFFCITYTSQAQQSWAKPGAEWYYGNTGLAHDGYVHYQVDGDSTVLGKLCDRIKATSYLVQYWGSQYGMLHIIDYNRFVYKEGDSVMFYHKFDSTFHLMYDKNAISGSSASNANFGCDSSTTYIIDSVSSQNISGNNHTVFYFGCTAQIYCASPSALIEDIGVTYGYDDMFPTFSCYPAETSFTLRCYSDSSGTFYHPNTAIDCDSLNYTGIKENITISFEIKPNPVQDLLVLTWDKIINDKEAVLQIHNIAGQLVLEKENINMLSGLETVDVSGLKQGVYIVEIQSLVTSVKRKFIKE